MARRLAALARDRSGAIGLLGAGSLCVAIASLAFAVDTAVLYHQSRRLQGIADAAALAAAADLADPTTAARGMVAATAGRAAIT